MNPSNNLHVTHSVPQLPTPEISKLNLGPALSSYLAGAGYAQLEQLRAASDEELLRVRQVGRGTVALIRRQLAGNENKSQN